MYLYTWTISPEKQYNYFFFLFFLWSKIPWLLYWNIYSITVFINKMSTSEIIIDRYNYNQCKHRFIIRQKQYSVPWKFNWNLFSCLIYPHWLYHDALFIIWTALQNRHLFHDKVPNFNEKLSESSTFAKKKKNILVYTDWTVQHIWKYHFILIYVNNAGDIW